MHHHVLRSSLTGSLRRFLGRPSPAKSGATLTPAPGVRVSAHGDGLVILHIPSGRIFSCNSTGSRIWKSLAGGSRPDTISGEISREFGLAPAVAEQHARTFIEKLEHQQLLLRT